MGQVGHLYKSSCPRLWRSSCGGCGDSWCKTGLALLALDIGDRLPSLVAGMMSAKGILLILAFTGELEFKSFEYTYTGDLDDQVIACDTAANSYRDTISTHTWQDPRGHGYYLNNQQGTVQGHIC